MLDGTVVTLRELRRDDVPVFHALIDADPALHAVVRVTPWVPVPLALRQAEFDRGLEDPQEPDRVRFAVQRRTDSAGLCIGSAGLFSLDLHNRTAEAGLSLVPQSRGKGVGRDALDVLCRYAFEVRDLHRLSLGTLASNAAMLAVARTCGFVEEGRIREAAWVMGRREDEVRLGLLAAEWRARA